MVIASLVYQNPHWYLKSLISYWGLKRWKLDTHTHTYIRTPAKNHIYRRLRLLSTLIERRCATVFSSRHCFFLYEYNCVKFYQKISLNHKEQSPRWKFSESWNFLNSFFTRTSQCTSFGDPEFVIKYFINNSDFYCFWNEVPYTSVEQGTYSTERETLSLPWPA